MIGLGLLKQRGHTLLELIIALALALFISSALIEIFVQCKKNYDLTQRFNDMQTSARLALNWLSHDIRMAGLIGCVRLVDFSPPNTQLTSSNSLLAWQEGSNAVKFPTWYLSHAKYHTDVLLIQFMDPDTFSVNFAKGRTISLIKRPSFHERDKCVISDCQHAEVFEWGHANLQYTYQRNSEVGFLNKIVYYIGDTGQRNATGKPIFSLYRRNLNKPINTPIELVPGLETMSVRLGVMALNGVLNYLKPDQVGSWSDIRSVEITLITKDKKFSDGKWQNIIALRERNLIKEL